MRRRAKMIQPGASACMLPAALIWHGSSGETFVAQIGQIWLIAAKM